MNLDKVAKAPKRPMCALSKIKIERFPDDQSRLPAGTFFWANPDTRVEDQAGHVRFATDRRRARVRYAYITSM